MKLGSTTCSLQTSSFSAYQLTPLTHNYVDLFVKTIYHVGNCVPSIFSYTIVYTINLARGSSCIQFYRLLLFKLYFTFHPLPPQHLVLCEVKVNKTCFQIESLRKRGNNTRPDPKSVTIAATIKVVDSTAIPTVFDAILNLLHYLYAVKVQLHVSFDVHIII